jgi:hypothetical protein
MADFVEQVAREYEWRYALPWTPIVHAWRAAQRRSKRGPLVPRLRLPKPYDVEALRRAAADVLERINREGDPINRS